MKREFQIPERLETIIEKNLNELDLSLSDAKKIASAVQWQSDFYIENPNQTTPWKDRRAQIAQWAYYLPLNFLRNMSVIAQLKQTVPLDAFPGAFDYGAGLGASSWALRESGFQGSLFLYDRQPIAAPVLAPLQAENPLRWEPRSHQHHLGIFSYSLTEMQMRNDLLNQVPYVIIIEPSTQKEGRRLSETRDVLISKDYEIIAPCTHQKDCPLLRHSQRDWCHDRIFFKKPKWMAQIEKDLPFRNDSLTFSYLIAFKKALMKPEWQAPEGPLMGRLTGDILPEKGKSKQLVCFDEQRVFLTWMHKTKIDQTLPRGGLVEVPQDYDLVANEIRLKKEIKYLP
ncbi:MAG: hypothetical protein JNL11_08685 [Bdellovibrionaceae bacterium]|nr:hypothetical protein [Pseudobdellovibrionaceae bacterium]